MQNEAVLESIYSATFAEHYFDIVENLPDDLQRHLTRFCELDNEQCRLFTLAIDDLLDEYAQHKSDADAQNAVLVKMRHVLLAAQNVGDAKIAVVQGCVEMVDDRAQMLIEDTINMDNPPLVSLSNGSASYKRSAGKSSKLANGGRSVSLSHHKSGGVVDELSMQATSSDVDDDYDVPDRKRQATDKRRIAGKLSRADSATSRTPSQLASHSTKKSSSGSRTSLASASKTSDKNASHGKIDNRSKGSKRRKRLDVKRVAGGGGGTASAVSASAATGTSSSATDSPSANAETAPATTAATTSTSSSVARDHSQQGEHVGQPDHHRVRREHDTDADDIVTSTATNQSASGAAASNKRRASDSSSDNSVNFSGADVDPDEATYCLCDQVSYGDMIGCDNDLCPIEWFHFNCVQLTTKPKGKWFCPKCRQGDRANVMRPKAQFLRELERYNKEREDKVHAQQSGKRRLAD